MKSFDHLAQAAYEAYRKKYDAAHKLQLPAWADVPRLVRESWIAAAMAVAAEISTVL